MQKFLLSIQKLSEATINDILQKHASTLGELTKSSEGKPWETPKPETIDQSDFFCKKEVRLHAIHINVLRLREVF